MVPPRVNFDAAVAQFTAEVRGTPFADKGVGVIAGGVGKEKAKDTAKDTAPRAAAKTGAGMAYYLVPHLKAQVEELVPLMAFRAADGSDPAPPRGQGAHQKDDDANDRIDYHHTTLLGVNAAAHIAIYPVFMLYFPYDN